MGCDRGALRAARQAAGQLVGSAVLLAPQLTTLADCNDARLRVRAAPRALEERPRRSEPWGIMWLCRRLCQAAYFTAFDHAGMG